MAYNLVRASSQSFTVNHPSNTVGKLSISMLCRLASVPSNNAFANRFMMMMRANSSASGYYAMIQQSNLVNGYAGTVGFENVQAVTHTTGVWFQLGFTWDFSTTTATLKIYRDGALVGSGSSTRGTVSNSSEINRIGSFGLNEHFNGQLAEFGVWNEILTDSEWSSLARFRPNRIRPSALVRYYPFVRNQNEIRSGTVVTPVNTPTVFDHPSIS